MDPLSQRQRYLVIIEKADRNYSAYSPDLSGCIATGKTREEVTRKMQETIELHIRVFDDSREDYFYTANYFVSINVPRAAERALFTSSSPSIPAA